ncbi:hypothetical protein C2S51_033321 [Perilla frutescens var. frutescens]|nr:hypothetical protein C2S51_033321 [Perilla frutescens var. frutescens]
MTSGAARLITATHGGLTVNGAQESKLKMPLEYLMRYSKSDNDEKMPACQVDGRLLSEYGRAGNQVATPAYEFRMPLHYPRYSKSDYENMPEWKLDRLLSEYGLPVIGDVHHKRNFAMGAFLWPDQYNA